MWIIFLIVGAILLLLFSPFIIIYFSMGNPNKP